MDDIKNRIRTFLKETGMSRDVFAGLCGVRKNQVNKWLSSSPIPEPRRQLIERVMEEEYRQRRKSPHNPNMYILEVPFPTEEYENAVTTAANQGMTVPELASKALVVLCKILNK